MHLLFSSPFSSSSCMHFLRFSSLFLTPVSPHSLLPSVTHSIQTTIILIFPSYHIDISLTSSHSLTLPLFSLLPSSSQPFLSPPSSCYLPPLPVHPLSDLALFSLLSFIFSASSHLPSSSAISLSSLNLFLPLVISLFYNLTPLYF